MEADKQIIGKLRYGLICPFVLEEIAKVFTYGANKYDSSYFDVNYKKPHSRNKLYESTMRHIQEYIKEKEMGDDGNDIESGLSHLTHAIANLIMMNHQEIFNKFIEDNEDQS